MWFILLIIILLFYALFQCRGYKFFQQRQKISAGEARCKKWLQEHFGLPFDKIRPDWLKNPTFGKNLEIDCFNAELGIGVEYNGEQHYMIVDKFGGNKASLEYSQYKDKLKQTLCRQNGVYLIIVPYWEKNIEDFLAREISLWDSARRTISADEKLPA